MLWIILGLLVGLLVALWKFLGSQERGKNLGREEFQRDVRALLILMENGGVLHIKHRNSDVAFHFVRSDGAGEGATVFLEIPRATWSEQCKDKLYQVLRSNNFDVALFADPSSKRLAQVRVPVDDIWVVWSGAKPARAGHLLLDALGLPGDARFDVALDGPRSTRALKRKEPIRGG